MREKHGCCFYSDTFLRCQHLRLAAEEFIFFQHRLDRVVQLLLDAIKMDDMLLDLVTDKLVAAAFETVGFPHAILDDLGSAVV